MSTRLITQLNPFSSERKIQEIENSTIQEIINKIDIHKAVNTGWRVLLNDEVVTDFQQKTKDGDTLYLKIVPEGDNQEIGVAEKWVGGITAVAGVALIIAGAFTGGSLSGIGVSVLLGGISMFVSGVCIYNTELPKLDSNKTERSPSIRGSRNQSRPMGYLPVLFGRRRIYADVASNSYTWVDTDGEQYLYQLFCAAQKDIAIDTKTIKLGETSLLEYSQTSSMDNILNGADPWVQMQIIYGGTVTEPFQKCVHEEAVNNIIKKKVDDKDNFIIATTPDNTEEINVDIFFYNGLGKYNDKGELEETSVTVEAYYKFESEPDSKYQLLGYFGGNTNEIKGSELKTKRYSVTKSGLRQGKYSVKIVRVTDDHDEDSKIVDDVYVGSIRSIKHEHAVSDLRAKQLTLVCLKLKASAKINSFVEELNFEAQSFYKKYDSNTKSWVGRYTSNPAAAALYAMQGPMSQQKLADSDIDWSSFEKLSAWCDEKEYECNELVYDSIGIADLLSAIGSTCRAEILRQFGKITVIQDIAKDGFTQIFTPRNSWDYEEQILFPAVPDALSLSFVDKASGYAEQELKVYNTPSGNRISEPDTIQDVQLWGVTSNVQARKLGMYKYAVTKNRPLVHKFSADFEYLLCQKGDWIKYAGDIALAGITQGRVAELLRENGQIIGVVTDEELPMEFNKKYAIRIRKNDGTAIITDLVNFGAPSNRAMFAKPLTDDINEGDLFVYGYHGTDSIDLIVTDIQAGDDLTADIIAVEYAPEIFGVDAPDFVLPNFVNRITDVTYAADSGSVDQSDWPTFTTYNDSSSRPATPTGNGNSGGWHTYYTASSKWQSNKRAKNINLGQWSAPVNVDYFGALKNVYANHIVTIYKKSSSKPSSTGITTELIYNFQTNKAIWTDNSGANGWVTDIRNITGSGQTYQTSATAFSNEAEYRIQPNEWAEPLPMGLNGRDGISTYTVQLFKRVAVEPAKPRANITYNFETNELGGDLESWNTSFPAVDTNGNPVWEIHATAMSSTTTDTIQPNEWSKPKIISQDVEITKAQIQQMIEDMTVTPTPNVYADVTFAQFQVNSEGRITIPQSVTTNIHVRQGMVEIGFAYGVPEFPDNTNWDYSINGNQITINVKKGALLQGGHIIIPIIYRQFRDNYEYHDGQGDVTECIYGDENGQAYGAAVYANEETVYNVSIGFTAVKGGIYRHGISSLADLPSDELIIGDYITWTGKTTKSSLSSEGEFVETRLYEWNGYEWEPDHSTLHMAGGLADVLKTANSNIESGNPMVDTLLKRLTANETFTKYLVVTDGAFINALATVDIVIGNQELGEGSIRTYNYEPGRSGVLISAKKTELVDVLVRGTIQADKFELMTEDSRIQFNKTLAGFGVAKKEDVEEILLNYPTDDDLKKQLGDLKQDIKSDLLKDTQIIRLRRDRLAVPELPTSQVTTTATDVNNTWTRGYLTYSDKYKYYFWCYQYIFLDGSVKWSEVYVDSNSNELNNIFYTKAEQSALDVVKKTAEGLSKNVTDIQDDIATIQGDVGDAEKRIEDVESELTQKLDEKDARSLTTVTVVPEESNFFIEILESGRTPSMQIIEQNLHAYLGLNTEVDFEIKLELFKDPDWILNHDNHKAYLSVAAGTYLTAGSIKIPVKLIKTTQYDQPYNYWDGKTAYANAVTTDENEVYYAVINYVARTGGVYKGRISRASQLPTHNLPEDFITWIGASTTATINGIKTEFKQGCLYKWDRQWIRDHSTEHFSRAMDDVLELSNDILKQNNSEVDEFFRRVVTKQMFTDQLVANEAFIDRLVGNDGFIKKFGSRELTIQEGGYIASDNFIRSNGTEGFFLGTRDKLNGLFIANNAIIRGEVYATKGTFVGDVVAKSLKLGDKNITNIVQSLDGYAKNDDVATYVNKNAISEVTQAKSSDGSSIVKVKKDGKTQEFKVVDTADYLYLGKDYGTHSEDHTKSYTKISKEGLLEANNALIYGTVYATNGEFSGKIQAKDFNFIVNKGTYELGSYTTEDLNDFEEKSLIVPFTGKIGIYIKYTNSDPRNYLQITVNDKEIFYKNESQTITYTIPVKVNDKITFKSGFIGRPILGHSFIIKLLIDNNSELLKFLCKWV